jgi:GTP cyclohydrolase FolE2
MTRVTVGSAPLAAAQRLPRHTRLRPGFAETFGRSADATIAAMDRAGDDVPDRIPAVRIGLQRIGVERQAVPVSIVDPFDRTRQAQLACSLGIHASLGPTRRGIHTSRLGDLVARVSEQVFDSLQHCAAEVCERTLQEQQCDDAEVRIGGVIAYREDVRGAAGKTSLEHLELAAQVRSSQGTVSGSTSVGFSLLTACPCVQQTFKHARHERDGAALGQMLEHGLPFMTHSQRCRCEVTLSSEGMPAPPPLPDLLDAIDRTVVRCQNTLPRDLELLMVHRAHAEPQFVEDVLRGLLRAIHERVRTSHAGSTITIRAASMESIHDFDISGAISYTVAELNGGPLATGS